MMSESSFGSNCKTATAGIAAAMTQAANAGMMSSSFNQQGVRSMKHTPGPWETGAVMTRVEVLPDGWRVPMCIADCHAKLCPETEAERVANAKLIAAAPDLLEALQHVYAVAIQLWGHNPNDSCLHEAAAAIAKATT
jgi:hypothetical protein